jgi:thioredoxin 1
MDELERIKRRKMRELMKGKVEKLSMPSSPVDVTDQDFNSIVQRYPLMVVDCWAAWCGPCLMVSPIIEGLARDYAGRVAFGKLNVDKNPETAARFGVMSIPTLLVFKEGRLVDRVVGAVPRQRIELVLKKYM